jgi:hypothetical protein
MLLLYFKETERILDSFFKKYSSLFFNSVPLSEVKIVISNIIKMLLNTHEILCNNSESQIFFNTNFYHKLLVIQESKQFFPEESSDVVQC